MATKLFLLLILGVFVSSEGIGGGGGKSLILPVMLLTCRLELEGRGLSVENCEADMVVDIELGRLAV